MPNYHHEQEVLRRDALPIPQNKSPVGRKCIQIDIPDDLEWEEQFFSILTLLTKWNSYEKEATRSAKFIAAQWRDTIWHHIAHCDGTPIRRGIEIEEEMPLRIDCDCNVWVTCCDGTEKQLLTADQVRAL